MPDTMPRDPEVVRPLFLGAIRLLLDLRAQRLPVQSARSLRARPGICQPIQGVCPVVHAAAADLKPPRRFGLAAPAPDKLDDAFAQILTTSPGLSIAALLLNVPISLGPAILQTVWPGTYVTDTALKVCINGIRKVLEDDAKSPRFIE